MRTILGLFLLILSLSAYAAPKGIILTIDGPIGPATQDYVSRGLEQAEKEQATIVILKLNTPGGLETAMRGITQAIIHSPIPVVTYVTPAGARAASAGTFIIYASHFAAMAPGTNIGAATPVNLVASDAEKKADAHEKKATNDAAAYIRSLGQLRGHNIDWGQKAVTQALSISSQEAKELNVIDVIADNDQSLLQALDGKTYVDKGVQKVLSTKGVQLETVTPDWRYRFLAFITDPNVTYLLIFIAMYGIFFELANPGLILPGVAGSIALLLVLYAFQLMPVNYVGLALIILGLIFICAEFYLSTFGIIGVGGIIAFMIGSVMLFDMYEGAYQIDWSLIITMAIATVVFFLLLANLAFRSHKKKVITGSEGLIGSEGIVISTRDHQIIVRVLGEIWEAKSSHPLETNDAIKVTGRNGLLLTVVPIKTTHEIEGS